MPNASPKADIHLALADLQESLSVHLEELSFDLQTGFLFVFYYFALTYIRVLHPVGVPHSFGFCSHSDFLPHTVLNIW